MKIRRNSVENDGIDQLRAATLLAKEVELYQSCSFHDLAKLVEDGPEEYDVLDKDGVRQFDFVASAVRRHDGAIIVTIEVAEENLGARFVMTQKGSVYDD